MDATRAGHGSRNRHVPLTGPRPASGGPRSRHIQWPAPHWETICLVVASTMISLGCIVTMAAAVVWLR